MDWAPLWTSLITAIPATMITFVLGIFAAHKVVKSDRGIRRVADVILTLPLVLPPTVAGFILLMLLGKHGFLGAFLTKVGIKIIFTRSAIIVASVVISFPLMYRSAKAAFEQVDRNLIYAGRTLGMSEGKIFWRIIMPLALPGVGTGGILALARAFGEFGATLMLAGNIPKLTQTMPLAIYTAIQAGNRKEAAILCGILIVISFFMIFFMNYFAVSHHYRERERRKHESKG
ncbi:MAG: molybdate transporter, permease protein [Herbinix sp.]|jgi:molybdate transport system permease protein|nr:molybdate transporter, permease protein [Herbinix sp.]